MELRLEWHERGAGWGATVCGIELLAWPETETRAATWMTGGPFKSGNAATLRVAQEMAESAVYEWLKEGVMAMGGTVQDG